MQEAKWLIRFFTTIFIFQDLITFILELEVVQDHRACAELVLGTVNLSELCLVKK